MQKVFNLEADFVASQVRNIITSMQNLLYTVESQKAIDEYYFNATLHQVESGLRRLEKRRFNN